MWNLSVNSASRFIKKKGTKNNLNKTLNFTLNSIDFILRSPETLQDAKGFNGLFRYLLLLFFYPKKTFGCPDEPSELATSLLKCFRNIIISVRGYLPESNERTILPKRTFSSIHGAVN